MYCVFVCGVQEINICVVVLPTTVTQLSICTSLQVINPQVVPTTTHELLNRITGQGLQVHYQFSRNAHISSTKMLAIKLTFTNTLETALSAISIGDTRLQTGMAMREMTEISQLAPNSSSDVTLGIDFNDTLQPAKFDIW